ncbi:MAG: L,D-transpeptidase [Candidatus Woesearchaeota archaeon]
MTYLVDKLIVITGCLFALGGTPASNLPLPPINPRLEEIIALGEQLEEPYIVIYKYTSTLYFVDQHEIKEYEIATGMASGKKNKSGDFKTPEGTYSICDKHPSDRFRKFLEINYPNEKDAKNALEQRRISRREYESIIQNLKKGKCPSPNTYLGGVIGIHGPKKLTLFGEEFSLATLFNWTRGCIATDEEGIDQLYQQTPLKTTVIIKD